MAQIRTPHWLRSRGWSVKCSMNVTPAILPFIICVQIKKKKKRRRRVQQKCNHSSLRLFTATSGVTVLCSWLVLLRLVCPTSLNHSLGTVWETLIERCSSITIRSLSRALPRTIASNMFQPMEPGVHMQRCSSTQLSSAHSGLCLTTETRRYEVSPANSSGHKSWLQLYLTDPSLIGDLSVCLCLGSSVALITTVLNCCPLSVIVQLYVH